MPPQLLPGGTEYSLRWGQLWEEQVGESDSEFCFSRGECVMLLGHPQGDGEQAVGMSLGEASEQDV